MHIKDTDFALSLYLYTCLCTSELVSPVCSRMAVPFAIKNKQKTSAQLRKGKLNFPSNKKAIQLHLQILRALLKK